MSGKMTRRAYEDLVRENIEWLLKQPRSLERDHIHEILKASPGHEYGSIRPHVITLCGSTRFTSEMLREAWRLTIAGNIVIHWNILEGKEAFAHGAEREGGNVKEIIDGLYLYKVSMADEIRVINVEGYVGESTTTEVKHALKLGKKITWLEPDKANPELCSS